MERTKNLVMDEKEKQEFARRGLTEKLRAVMRRYEEEIVDKESFLDEYQVVAGDRVTKSGAMIDVIIEEFPLSSESEKLFDLLDIMGKETGAAAAKEVQSLRSRFHKELADKMAEAKVRITERLREMGIGGSSVEPNLEAWDEWRHAVREMGSRFGDRLQEWKEKTQTSSR